MHVASGGQQKLEAAEAGLRRQDVILEVDRSAIADADDLRDLLDNAGPGALLLVRRGESTSFVPINRPS